MTLHDLNELAGQQAFAFHDLTKLHEKYPAAKKEFVEQVLSYVKKHGVPLSFAFMLMEMDDELLQYFGLSNPSRIKQHNNQLQVQ